VVEHRHDLPVAMMCGLLEIKPTGFYAWLRRGESHRSIESPLPYCTKPAGPRVYS